MEKEPTEAKRESVASYVIHPVILKLFHSKSVLFFLSSLYTIFPAIIQIPPNQIIGELSYRLIFTNLFKNVLNNHQTHFCF